eukprot:CAMPEP_0185816162 /NCGR_PEP_ID=MMETSP1322-20130828/16985_1 /TAXON_ID=265543 /ORGANISM="Minutocellus polymorphus, Strain RCC2270" /LENGTH=30 /DNA_ID= /DNA_START= /DNA_END= /DNA_ORIENTATION=
MSITCDVVSSETVTICFDSLSSNAKRQVLQ